MGNVSMLLKNVKNTEEEISLLRFESLNKEISKRLFDNEINPNALWDYFIGLDWKEQPSTDLNVKVLKSAAKCLAGAVNINSLTEFDTIKISQRDSVIPNSECHYFCDNATGVYSDALVLVLYGDEIDGFRFYNCYDEGTWLYAHQPVVRDIAFKDAIKVSKDVLKSKGINWVRLNRKAS